MSNRVRSLYNTARSESDSTLVTVAAFVLITVVCLALFAGIAVLSALVTKLAWNLGVVAIVAACGGHVAKISLLTALFFNIAWGIITRPFRRTTTESA